LLDDGRTWIREAKKLMDPLYPETSRSGTLDGRMERIVLNKEGFEEVRKINNVRYP
jgi:hypothetical protein